MSGWIGGLMIAAGLTAAAFDSRLQRSFNSGSCWVLLFELADFMLVLGGLMEAGR